MATWSVDRNTTLDGGSFRNYSISKTANFSFLKGFPFKWDLSVILSISPVNQAYDFKKFVLRPDIRNILCVVYNILVGDWTIFRSAQKDQVTPYHTKIARLLDLS